MAHARIPPHPWHRILLHAILFGLFTALVLWGLQRIVMYSHPEIETSAGL